MSAELRPPGEVSVPGQAAAGSVDPWAGRQEPRQAGEELAFSSEGWGLRSGLAALGLRNVCGV